MELNWADHTQFASPVGFSSLTVSYFYYYKIGSLIVCNIGYDGTSNATSFTLSLPFSNTILHNSINGRVTDNGSTPTDTGGRISFGNGTSTLTIYKDANATAWTGSGNKVFYGQFFYFTS
jgi:hypothetical protein